MAAGPATDLLGHRTMIVTQKVHRHQTKPVLSTGATYTPWFSVPGPGGLAVAF